MRECVSEWPTDQLLLHFHAHVVHVSLVLDLSQLFDRL